MLGKLVYKFKRQSLQEQTPPLSTDPSSADTTLTPNNNNALASEIEHAGKARNGNEQQQSLLQVESPTAGNATRRSARIQARLVASSNSVPNMKSSSDAHKRGIDEGVADSRAAFDSGTESENDEELVRLDAVADIARGSSMVESKCTETLGCIGSSPPVLTSSPPLVSEIDTNSLDSAGCESGIVLRESAERDNDTSSRSLDYMDALDIDSTTPPAEGLLQAHACNHSMLTTCCNTNTSSASNPPGKQAPIDFSSLHYLGEKRGEPLAPFTIENTGGGAFKPVPRRGRITTRGGETGQLAVPSALPQQLRTNTPSPNNFAGEKRRWAANEDDKGSGNEHSMANAFAASPMSASPVASRTRGSLLATVLNNEMPRTTLTAQRSTAHRRTRVRVIYHHASPVPKRALDSGPTDGRKQQLKQHKVYGESPPHTSLSSKRGRLLSFTSNQSTGSSSCERPSLNFDKMMRERMMHTSQIAKLSKQA